jgi:hypothetical protein
MEKSKKFILIYAEPYSDMVGGIVALHKLCHMINEAGRNAYLLPMYAQFRIDVGSTQERAINLAKTISLQDRYTLKPGLNTPVIDPRIYTKIPTLEDVVVLYPEIICGNPLDARHVVRWFLHDPGHFTKKVYYHTGELYFCYGPETKPVIIPGSKLSKTFLEAPDYPLEHYNTRDWSEQRSGTAYLLKKGRHKPICHPLEDSILIDGMSHAETAAIFKRVKRFISYDSRTAYSKFAALCGCESVVIPDRGVSEDEWCPDPFLRAGIAYGFDNVEAAKGQMALVEEYFAQRDEVARASVASFLDEVDAYFDSP